MRHWLSVNGIFEVSIDKENWFISESSKLRLEPQGMSVFKKSLQDFLLKNKQR